MSRDPAYERTFLREAYEACDKRYAVGHQAFEYGTAKRLDMGEELYADAYLSHDARQHILEEAHDSAAYAVLEAQRRLADGNDDAAAYRLFEIAVHAAAIDAHARALRSDE